MNTLFTIFKFSNSTELTCAILLFASICLLMLVQKYISVQPVKTILISLSLILAIKLILYHLPGSHTWQLELVMNSDLFKGREHSIAKLEYKNHLKEYNTRFLAFGDSQIGFIFNEDKLIANCDYDAVFIPGLRMCEYQFYIEWIQQLKPEYLILYLNDSHLAGVPDIIPLKYGPVSTNRLISLYRQFEKNGFPLDRNLFMETWIGSVMPTYKYAHFFKKGLSHCLFNDSSYLKNMLPLDSFRLKNITHNLQPKSLSEEMKDPYENISISKDAPAILNFIHKKEHRFRKEYFDFNLQLLEDFIEEITAHEINLILIDGHYHPYVFKQHTKFTDQMQNAFEAIAKNSELVFHIKRNQLMELMEEDYFDDSHLKLSVSNQLFDDIHININSIVTDQ